MASPARCSAPARIALVWAITRALLVGATFVRWPLLPCLQYEVPSGDGRPPVVVAVPWRIDASGERVALPGDQPRWLDAFARMDGLKYLTIMAVGYGRNPDGSIPDHAGFFPGYPVAATGVAKVLNTLRGRPGATMLETPVLGLVAAFLTSNFALLLAAIA